MKKANKKGVIKTQRERQKVTMNTNRSKTNKDTERESNKRKFIKRQKDKSKHKL